MKVRQRDLSDCGVACLASVAGHYGHNLSLAKLRQYAGTNEDGTTLFAMATVAELVGFQAKAAKGDMKALDKLPCPCIAHMQESKGQHYVVVYKVLKDKVKIMDPTLGEYAWLGKEEFGMRWTGALLLMVPSHTKTLVANKISRNVWFWALLKPHKAIFVQVIFGALVYTILGLASSVYIGKLADHVLVSHNVNLLNLMSVAMLLVVFLQVFIGACKSIFVYQTGQKIDAQLILGYYAHLFQMPQSFFDQMKVGEVISRINDAVKIRTWINEGAIEWVVCLVTALVAFLFMCFYHFKLAILMALVLPLYALVYFIYSTLHKRNEKSLMESYAVLESQLFESIHGMGTIKSLGVGAFIHQQTEIKFVHFLHQVYRSGLADLGSSALTDLVNKIFTVLLLWKGSYWVIQRELSPGELLSMYALIHYFFQPLAKIVGASKGIQGALVASDRLFEIMELKREDSTPQVLLTKERLGNLHFDQVSFGYQINHMVFDSLTLDIPIGKMTVLLGGSGSGKSTIASLLLKLYEPQSGQILVGEYPLNQFSAGSVRKIMGVVPQHCQLFTGNILDNIAVGVYEPDLERVHFLCHALGLTDLIRRSAEGLYASVGEGGMALSGGQRQRLAIARALYHNPEILIMDEATSALDQESERKVWRLLDMFRAEGKTLVLISHRLNHAKHADQIVVLDHGRVVETGVHQSLLELGGYYANWYVEEVTTHIDLERYG